MAISQVASGGQNIFIVRYIAPGGIATIKGIVAAFGHIPHKTALKAAVDFNANLADPEGNHREEEILAIMTANLEVMTAHFHAKEIEGGEVMVGPLDVVGSGGHFHRGREGGDVSGGDSVGGGGRVRDGGGGGGGGWKLGQMQDIDADGVK